MCVDSFGCIFGILLICVAVILLLWNEGRAVRRAQLLDEALSKCQPLTDTELVFDSNNGHLVHLTGTMTTDEPLVDTQYGVSVPAVKLRRRVEMYQWMEHAHTEEYEEDGEKKKRTTYHYSREWRTDLVNSLYFAERWFHENPSTFPIKHKKWIAQQAMVGSFQLSPALLDLISDWKPVQLSLTPEMEQEQVKIHDDYIYYSHNHWFPEIGDVRINYDFAGMCDPANPNYVSIIARQSLGGQLTTYYSADQGEELLLLHFGVESHEEMLARENMSNIMMTWLYRTIGWIVSVIGFHILTNLGRCIGDLPIIREMINCGLLIANLLLASSVTLTTIAIGWLRHRPLIAIALFSSAAIPYMIIRRRGRNPKSNLA